MRCGFVQKLERVLIFIEAESTANHAPEAFQRTESFDDSGWFVAATDHAVGALGIAAGNAVFFPLGGLEQLLECVGIAVLEQVAGTLPAEDVVGGRTPGGAFILAVAHQEFEEQGRHIELPRLLAIREDRAEHAADAGAAEEAVLVRRFLVAVAGRKHDAFDAHRHNVVKESANVVGIGAIEECGVGGDTESALDGFLDAFDGDVVSTFAADREVVMFAIAVEMDGEGEVLRRREFGQTALEFERVGAKVDVFLARDKAVDDFDDLRMEQGLAAGDGHHGRAALFDRGKALFGRELLLEDVRRILHLAAAGTGQVAAEERLQHQDERIALVAGKALLQYVRGNRPHLRDRNSHLCFSLRG